MRGLLQRLWDDDAGALYATEWVLIAGIAVFGLIPGLVAVRNGTNSALATQANALLIMSSDFSFAGYSIVSNGTTIAVVAGVSGNGNPNTFQAGTGPVVAGGIFVNPAP
jgi:hypothetical protein